MAPLLNITELSISFKQSQKKVTIVDRINISLEAGKTLGVVGESGCGKSVTSLSVMRLLGKNAEISGKIRFQDTDLLSLTEKEMQKIRGNDIAMIFQEPMTSLNPLYKIGRQISEPLTKHRALSKQEAKEKAIELLKEVGIPRAAEIFSEYPHQLSGGMRQRVMIAMAMACNPKVLIADEPTTALDVTIQAQILELMKKVKREHGTAILLITHDMGVVAEMCDRVIVMYAGQIVEEADVKSLFREPKHPYTIGLMNSIPELNADKDRLESIPGSVPSAQEMPKGCRFAPRCSKAMDICREVPHLLAVTDSHKCRCWLYADAREGAV
ncbi:ABC transporter ATP-binding protein [Paenibacillus frigoriresistens]|uniref:ABC transporter ATP-binding protein n=1 Tax=Paenibacillus alginolyticus TaxID=59839 RepID=UPI001564CFCC|nr:ABC transporter ATP-binding protein [Paenibacillus frigoriresistens]NRF94409.1 ABC transporter ATP-binding protein [Paenibacillus frigoriresistens]